MRMTPADSLPTGPISFLFTDVEGSTRLVQALGELWVDVLARHNAILREAVGASAGFPIKTEGDSLFAVFGDARAAVAAAVHAQERLASEPWPEGHDLRVRMGIHTGEAALVGADYVGLEVHRAARIADAAHGGQIVISEPTAILVEADLPEGASVRDLGKHRLKDLSEPEGLFQVTIEGLAAEFPPLRTLDAIPNNLPAQVTTFVGRKTELAKAVELLSGTRVLTLTGPGGTGKTRLSLQVAAEVSHLFDDGVFFVELSPVLEVEIVPSVILNALGLSASSKDEAPRERLVNQLRSKAVLLILDNFEQLLSAAPIVSEMVRGAPRSKFVVTSRAPLRISGEQEFPVPPLATGGAATVEAALRIEGVQLLIDRAMAVRPDFSLTPGNVAAVVELVEMLDGLPLAIELVASRIRLLPVESILNHLDARMLSSGSVDLPERQRTITNAIDWSYGLLGPAEQHLFRRLSVFSGGARLEEIEALCLGWDLGIHLLDGLQVLVDHSLLSAIAAQPSPRFRMLHVIREFAMERLAEAGEAEAAQVAHLDVYTELVERAAPELLRKDRRRWLDLLDADHDNIRVALEWGVANGRNELVQRLAAASWRFWQARGHLHEAKWRLEQALAMAGGNDRHRAKVLEALGGVYWWRGEMDRCVEMYESALGLHRALGDERELANALYNYGLSVGFHLSEPDRSRALIGKAREIYERLGDEDGLGDVAWGLGNTHIADRQPAALEEFKKAAAHYGISGNEFGLGWSTFEVGGYYARTGDFENAWPPLRQAMELFGSHQDVSGVVMVGSELAAVALGLGDRSRAYRMAGMVDTQRVASGVDLVSIDFNVHEGLERETLGRLEGDDRVVYEEGKRADLPTLVAYVLAGPTDVERHVS